MSSNLIDLILHVDRSVAYVFQEWGWVAWTIVFLIVFIETGVVVFPFLPGDTLLFACGAFAATQGEPVWVFLILIGTAALLGNTVNWFVGKSFGSAFLEPHEGKKPLIRPEHLEETHAFFQKWGGWAVTLSRFVPIVRTVTPFVAGVGKMPFGVFSFYNALGGIGWTLTFVLVGFFFGNLPWVKDNFSFLVLAVLVLSVLPAVIAFVKSLKKKS